MAGTSSTVVEETSAEAEALLAQAGAHSCFRHELFSHLENCHLTRNQAGALLRNYDAHATVLRRLLLKVAAIMPEKAVGFVLENVRNEYGNGKPAGRHQLQLRDLACAAGVSQEQFAKCKIEAGVRDYIKQIIPFYLPAQQRDSSALYRPAIAAGAIAATEIMSMHEFRAMQVAFQSLALSDHIWFDHVTWEAQHTEESLALSLYFINEHDARASVELGMSGVLAATSRLYDGLLSAMTGQH